MNQSTNTKSPKVSLGMPVYNGEKYLGETFDAILAQTFTDFELIISDNASTDATQKICEDYALSDSRIKYIKQAKNLGAAANYNFVFSQATGEYFKWCPHDDILAENFLEECVAVLDKHPRVVGAMPNACFIDGEGQKIKDVRLPIVRKAHSPAKRFTRGLWKAHDWLLFFGLYRRRLVAQTDLHGNYVRSDHVFVSDMFLKGRIFDVPTSLLMFRFHNNSFTVKILKSQKEALAWMDPKLNTRQNFREIRFCFETAKVVCRSNIRLKGKAACLIQIAKFAWKRKRRAIFKELLSPFRAST